MFQLNDYINKGIKDIADTAGRFYLGNRRGQLFVLHLVSSLRKSTKLRQSHEKQSLHIPPFLIASIVKECNLKCAGCYARANDACGNAENRREDMSLEDWRRVFKEASEIGVSFILIAGGEPLLRRDVIMTAAGFDNIIFPVFTNGTMMDDEYLAAFDKHRNLIPVLSIEGDEAQTNARRGDGVAEQIRRAVAAFKEKGILYGVSITVTSENLKDVTSSSFVRGLREQGCGVIFYIEYVPVEKDTEHLILSNDELKELQAGIDRLRADRRNKGMIILSFPGDEEEMGGCLAAGRGFFHINADGGAEPCPFSPYSELNLKEQSLIDALKSPFFERIREISAAGAWEHKGGCTLFQHREEVEEVKTKL